MPRDRIEFRYGDEMIGIVEGLETDSAKVQDSGPAPL